jgi:hypothetical protein
MNTKRVIPLIIFIGFVVYIVYSTLQMGQFTCTVCVEFEGLTACRTASGETEEDALNAAVTNACAQVTSGMTNTRICTSKPPVSVEWK